MSIDDIYEVREAVFLIPLGEEVLFHQSGNGEDCMYCSKPIEDWRNTLEECPERIIP